MKTGIHPKYVETKVTCSCGNTFTTRSTQDEMHVELCNECHPFFTGRQKLVDTGGRVDRFQKRYGEKAKLKSKKAVKAETPVEAVKPAAKAEKAEKAPAKAEKAEKAPAKAEKAEKAPAKAGKADKAPAKTKEDAKADSTTETEEA